jgi:hypothetical protein
MKHTHIVLLVMLLESLPIYSAEPTAHKADVCIYGGTASGVMAAVAAAREGAGVENTV